MTFTDYESVRADETRFILAAGHADLRVERIVMSVPGYDVVEKLGVAAEVAADRDPRGDA